MSAFKGQATSKGAGGEGWENPQAGNLPAVVVALIDMGTHKDVYQGKESTNRKMFVVWELIGEKMSGTTMNHCIGREFTLSFHESATIRKFAEKWRGKSFAEGEPIEYGKMLGKKCLVQIIHKPNKDGTKTYARVDSVSDLPKGMSVGKPDHEPFVFDLDTSTELPEQDWLPRIFGEAPHEKIQRSDEWVARMRKEMDWAKPAPAGTSAAAGEHTPNEDDVAF